MQYGRIYEIVRTCTKLKRNLDASGVKINSGARVCPCPKAGKKSWFWTVPTRSGSGHMMQNVKLQTTTRSWKRCWWRMSLLTANGFVRQMRKGRNQEISRNRNLQKHKAIAYEMQYGRTCEIVGTCIKFKRNLDASGVKITSGARVSPCPKAGKKRGFGRCLHVPLQATWCQTANYKQPRGAQRRCCGYSSIEPESGQFYMSNMFIFLYVYMFICICICIHVHV